MTDKPETENAEIVPGSARYWGHLILWSVGLSFVLIAAVFVPIAIGNLSEGSGDLSDIIALVIAIPFAIFGGIYLWKRMPDFTMGEPHTPRGNRMRWIIGAIVVLGIAISFPLILTNGPDDDPLRLFSNSPLPEQAVWPMLAMWATGIPILIVLSRRNMDDFNRSAGDFGMMLGGQLFYYVTPLWWVAWRGGLLPRPDAMILFIAGLVAMNAGQLWKRYHG